MAESKAIAQQVGARIRQLRTERGMSLEKLALECGMNAAFLARVCGGLGVSLAELFLAGPDQETDCAAAIQHVTDRMRQLSPRQAQAVARLVDDALELLDP